MTAVEQWQAELSFVGPAPAIGEALRVHVSDIAARLAEGWQSGSAGENPAAVHAIWRATEAGTLAIAEYFTTGRVATDEVAEAWLSAAELALTQTITLSEVTALYLAWRHHCVKVAEQAAQTGLVSAAMLSTVRGVIHWAVDSYLVRMAKRYDTAKAALERQLNDEVARLQRRALYDPLTGAANRLLVLDRLEHALRSMERGHSAPGVLFVDLDRFKTVNDSFGHSFGDEVLRRLTTRIQERLRSTDTLGRFGGDEFVMVCEDLAGGLDEIRAIAKRLLPVIEWPVQVDGLRVTVTASIGATTAEADDSPVELLSRADRAMYRAKAAGGKRISAEGTSLINRVTARDNRS